MFKRRWKTTPKIAGKKIVFPASMFNSVDLIGYDEDAFVRYVRIFYGDVQVVPLATRFMPRE